MRQSSRTHLGSSSKACGYMQQVITRFMGFSVLCKNKLFALIDSHTCPHRPRATFTNRIAPVSFAATFFLEKPLQIGKFCTYRANKIIFFLKGTHDMLT